MTLIMRGLALVCIFLGFIACSSNEEKEALKPLPLVELESSVELTTVWSVKVGKGLDEKRYTTFYPAIEDDKIFAADKNGNVFAYDLETGKRIWKTELNFVLFGAVSVEKGQVFVGGYDGEVVALDATDGKELWRAETSSEVLAPPQSNGRQVVVASINGALTVFKASNGEQIWTYGHTTPALTNRGIAAPLVTATQVIAAFDNGQVLAFNATDGSSLWELRAAQPTGRHDLERIVDIDGKPLLASGFVYVATYQGAIISLMQAQGRIIWKQKVSTFQPLAYADGKVYLTADDGRVIAYKASNGSVEWENSQMLRRGVAAPAVFGAYLAVIDEEGYMHLLDQADGHFVGRVKPKGDKFSSPILSYEDRLYVLANNGRLTAYRIQ